MTAWTNDETVTLISLWPTHSAMQIGKRLQRPRKAICRKAERLRDEGLLPHGGIKHFEVVPPRVPRVHQPQASILPKKPPAPPSDDGIAMRFCSILELDDARCHWPLGDVYEVAVRFCGGPTVPGRRYCPHHWRMAKS